MGGRWERRRQRSEKWEMSFVISKRWMWYCNSVVTSAFLHKCWWLISDWLVMEEVWGVFEVFRGAHLILLILLFPTLTSSDGTRGDSAPLWGLFPWAGADCLTRASHQNNVKLQDYKAGSQCSLTTKHRGQVCWTSTCVVSVIMMIVVWFLLSSYTKSLTDTGWMLFFFFFVKLNKKGTNKWNNSSVTLSQELGWASL